MAICFEINLIQLKDIDVFNNAWEHLTTTTATNYPNSF